MKSNLITTKILIASYVFGFLINVVTSVSRKAIQEIDHHHESNIFFRVTSADNDDSDDFINFKDTANILSHLFEGDIMPSYNTIAADYGIEFAEELVSKGLMSRPLHQRSAAVPSKAVWRQTFRQDTYVVIIYINPDDYDWEQKSLIKKNLLYLSRKSGVVKFWFPKSIPTNGKPFLHIGIHEGNGCWSYVGLDKDLAYSKNGQPVNLGIGCLTTRTIQHEVMHALGFQHEQTRPDRDKYIDIHLENVVNGYEPNFGIRTNVNYLGVPYDYMSVMHYAEYSFTKNGQKTIDGRGNQIAGEIASDSDILTLRLMYQCGRGAKVRTADEYNANPCTTECKCWRYMKGCSQDDECKGKLVCKNSRCMKA